MCICMYMYIYIYRIFAAAEHIRNHPNNVASATQSLLMHAEKCIATGGHFEQLL